MTLCVTGWKSRPDLAFEQASEKIPLCQIGARLVRRRRLAPLPYLCPIPPGFPWASHLVRGRQGVCYERPAFLLPEMDSTLD